MNIDFVIDKDEILSQAGDQESNIITVTVDKGKHKNFTSQHYSASKGKFM